MQNNIQSLLDKNNVCVLSIARTDGTVQSATVHFSYSLDPLCFYFSTDVNSRKGQLTADGPVKAAVVIGFNEETMQTFQLEGMLDQVAEADLDAAKEVHYARHPNARQYEDDPDTLFLVFAPTWARFSDYKQDPPIIEEVI